MVQIKNTYCAHKHIKRTKEIDGKKYYLDQIIDGKPVYLTTDNSDSANATRTNFLHNGGGLGLNLEGQNMTIGVWDGGSARRTHNEFYTPSSSVSRVTTPDNNTNNYDSHGTHVSGTIISYGFQPDAKGMAPQANLVSYDFQGDYGEVFNQSLFGALLVSNHSYGIPVNSGNSSNAPSWMMGCYNDDAEDWDQLHYNAPIICTLYQLEMMVRLLILVACFQVMTN